MFFSAYAFHYTLIYDYLYLHTIYYTLTCNNNIVTL